MIIVNNFITNDELELMHHEKVPPLISSRQVKKICSERACTP